LVKYIPGLSKCAIFHLGYMVSFSQLLHYMLEEQSLLVDCTWENVCDFDNVNGGESLNGYYEILSLPTFLPWL
jgi:hypothetical protein